MSKNNSLFQHQQTSRRVHPFMYRHVWRADSHLAGGFASRAVTPRPARSKSGIIPIGMRREHSYHGRSDPPGMRLACDGRGECQRSAAVLRPAKAPGAELRVFLMFRRPVRPDFALDLSPRYVPAARTGRRRRTVLVLFFTGLLIAIGAVAAMPTVFAHAAYVSSDPQPDAVLTSAPAMVTIHFAEPVNPTDSNVVVYDARQQQASTAPAQANPADLKTMTVAMKGDGSETYLVEWHTVSAVDGDPDIGAFTFTVNPSATPAGTPTPSSGNSGTATHATGTPGWLVALAGVLGVLTGAGIMALVRRGAR